MSSPGIITIDTDPLVIRTNDDDPLHNTYIVSRFDLPISTNYALPTSSMGQLVPSDSIYVSSLTTSSITAYVEDTDQCIISSGWIDSATSDTLTLLTLSTGTISGCMQNGIALYGDIACASTLSADRILARQFLYSTLTTSTFTTPYTQPSSIYLTNLPPYLTSGPNWIISTLSVTSTVISTLTYQVGEGDLVLLSTGTISSASTSCGLFSTMQGRSLYTKRTAARAVGISKTPPLYTMDVVGSINFTGGLYQHGQAYMPTIINLNPWISAPPSLYYSLGNVGIGSTITTYPLTTTGTSRFAIPSQASTTSSLNGYSTSLIAYSTSLTNYNSTMTAYNAAQSVYVNSYQSTTTGYNISVAAYQTAQATYTVAYQSTVAGAAIVNNAYQAAYLSYEIAYNSTLASDNAAWAAYDQAYAQWSALPASNFGINWVSTIVGTGGFASGVAVSSDGHIQTISIQTDGTTPSQILTSIDTGSTWTTDVAPEEESYGVVCMDPTGQYQGCVTFSGNLYVSQDSGSNWTAFPGTPSGYAMSVSIGPNAVFYLCYYGGMIYRTTSLIPDGITVNSAVQPDLAGITNNFISICSSRTIANIAYACSDNLSGTGLIYSIVSATSQGATWAVLGTAPAQQDYSWICCSDSGQVVVACTNNGQQSGSIYYSVNAGVTWNTANVPQLSWMSICCNGTGQYLLASAGADGFLYFSVDYGANWTVSDDSTTYPWSTVALSQNALQGVALTSGTNVAYESTTTVLQGPGPEPTPPTEPMYPVEPNPPPTIYYPDAPVAPIPPTYPTAPTVPSIQAPVPPTEPNPNPSALIVNGRMGIGTTAPNASLQVAGTINATSKNFDIPHPTLPGKGLLHSCIEGPRIELLYRGEVTLVKGIAHINLHTDSVSDPECAITDGTFQALATRSMYYLQNMTGFDSVLGIIEGSTLIIRCENTESNDTISWMVVSERADDSAREANHTNADGCLITEY